MRATLISVGHGRGGSPLETAFQDYAGRLTHPFNDIVIEARKVKSQSDEEKAILAKIPDGAYVIALDERGKTLSSRDFTKHIKLNATDMGQDICFVIGGADGLTDNLRKRANFLLSFGKQTFPHKLVRVMLIEQLYRAQQILVGHPYHRD